MKPLAKRRRGSLNPALTVPPHAHHILPPPILRLCRFEQAAERNNAEGLYNVGVLHSSGQIGYDANQTAALEFFNRSAHPVRPDQAPFPMALHALGGHYQNQGSAYWKTAKDYYKRAAQAGM
jgi:TPR repeat protein